MDKVIGKKYMMCEGCGTEHDVEIVSTEDVAVFKGMEIVFPVKVYRCGKSDICYQDEDMLDEGFLSMKDAYRKKTGLLTSSDIRGIRSRYKVTQKDLSIILGWGEKTLTRYETCQVQDQAHDSILRKLDSDPEWFISLMTEAKGSLSRDSYERYISAARKLFETGSDNYLRSSIRGKYAGYESEPDYTGGRQLSLDRVVDMIRYISNAAGVLNLYTVKMVKMLWYADALSFKRRGVSMSGMIYRALPMGAVPVAYDEILSLNGISYRSEEIGEEIARHFIPSGKSREYESLDEDDRAILDTVIREFGKATKDEIVNAMHNEEGYKRTNHLGIIPYSCCRNLSLS